MPVNEKDQCLTPGLKAVESTIADLITSITKLPDIEVVETNNLLDRITAEPIRCPFDFPSWPASAMDGYAFNYQSDASNSPLTIVGKALAGHPFTGSVGHNECVTITTGAPLPTGTDTVEMQENCSVSNAGVILKAPVKAAQHVRHIGSSIKAGQTLIPAGVKIGPKEQAIVASSGIAQAKVFKPLTIAVFTTGDELIAPGQSLQPGQIYDSNRLTMISMCQRMGYNTIDYGLVADNPDEIKRLMLEAANSAEVVMTSGGVSVGEADFIKPVLEEIGEIDVWKVAIKPGKPLAIGRIGDCQFFGLPGNPVSTIVTLNQVVQPALQKLSGQQVSTAVRFKAICVSELRKSPGRRDYQRGFAEINEEGKWQVTSTGPQGSGRLASVSQANCYIILAPENTGVKAGEAVTIELFDQSLS